MIYCCKLIVPQVCVGPQTVFSLRGWIDLKENEPRFIIIATWRNQTNTAHPKFSLFFLFPVLCFLSFFPFFFSFSLKKFCFGGYPERIYWMMDDQHQMSSSITSLNKYWLYGQSHWRWIRLKSTGKTTSPFLLFLFPPVLYYFPRSSWFGTKFSTKRKEYRLEI